MNFMKPATDSDAYYEPNSFNGPAERPEAGEPSLKIDGDGGRYNHRDGNDDFSQAGDLFRLMSAEQQSRLMDNICDAMQGVDMEIVKKQVGLFAKCDRAYGHGVGVRMGLDEDDLAAR